MKYGYKGMRECGRYEIGIMREGRPGAKMSTWRDHAQCLLQPKSSEGESRVVKVFHFSRVMKIFIVINNLLNFNVGFFSYSVEINLAC